jgi:hypothetical protein
VNKKPYCDRWIVGRRRYPIREDAIANHAWSSGPEHLANAPGCIKYPFWIQMHSYFVLVRHSDTELSEEETFNVSCRHALKAGAVDAECRLDSEVKTSGRRNPDVDQASHRCSRVCSLLRLARSA